MNIDVAQMMIEDFSQRKKEEYSSYGNYLIYMDKFNKIYNMLNEEQKAIFDEFDKADDDYRFDYMLDFANYIFKFIKSIV